MLDFGRAFNYWIDTTHLASEGARLAAVDSVPGSRACRTTSASKADTDELENGGSDWIAAPLEVCVNPDGDEVGDPVEVTVTTTYHFLPIGISASPASATSATWKSMAAPRCGARSLPTT